MAREQGDPSADQIEQQVLDSMIANVRAARVTHNYAQAAALLTSLKPLFPDRPVLAQMSSEVQQEQAEYANQLDRQRKAAEFQAQTKQFSLRHRHLLGIRGIRPVYSYCEGIFKVTPDGVARFDCTRTADPRGRCDHFVLNAGDIKELKSSRDGSIIRVVTSTAGNLDFEGDASAVQGVLVALQTLVRK
jgi:hypothetical protein